MQEQSFGTWLRKERRQLDFSRQALADQVGCAEITLRRIESGTLKPSRDLARLLLIQMGIAEPELNRWVDFARGLSESPIQPIGQSPSRPSSNLPFFLTSFIGREKEITALIDMIHRHRLVTITGPGGVGKTRLAEKIGEHVIGEFSDGVWLAELASQANPNLVSQTVAAVFGITTQSQTPYQELLVNYLRHRKLLLVLDNCEHLAQACAQLVDVLLKACPGLKILTTSRAALKIIGEAVYRLQPLKIPTEQSGSSKVSSFESVRLFEERAKLVQPDFYLTPENLPSIAWICRRLDGIPLAIEMATARLDVLSPEQIASKLEESFNLLTQGSRTSLPRQQTIIGSIEWSWQLLSRIEQTALQRLSIFAGGWNLEAAEMVCSGNGITAAQMVDLMTSLVAKSLVNVSKQTEKERRYRLHDLVQQFAKGKMQKEEIERTRRLHLDWCSRFSQLAESALHGPQQLDWLTRLGDEMDNLRAALDWAERTDLEAGLLIIGRLADDLDLCEGMDWAARLLAHPDSHKYPQARAKTLLAHAEYLQELQQFDKAQAAAQESLDLFHQCGDQAGEFDCLVLMGSIVQMMEGMQRKAEYHLQGLALARAMNDPFRQARALSALGWDRRDHEQSIGYWREATELFRQAGDWRSLGFLLAIMGDTLLSYGQLEEAQSLLTEASELNHRMKSKRGMEFILVAQSRQALRDGDLPHARQALEEWIDLAGEIGNRMGLLYGRARLGYVALCEGNLDEGYQILRNTALQFFDDGSPTGLAFTLERLAHYFTLLGDSDHAVRLIGWADATRQHSGDIRHPNEQAEVDRDMDKCKAALGEAAFRQAYAQGQTATLEEAARLADR